MNINLPKYIYHYCTISTFVNIIENSTIRLSDIRKSNDSKEIKWFLENFQTFILRKLINATDTYSTLANECIIVLDQIRKKLLDTSDTKELDDKQSILEERMKIEKNYINNLNKINDFFFKDNYLHDIVEPYVICLSSCRDSLSQWRGYGDDGYGVSIGFNMAYFKSLISDASSLMNTYYSLSLAEISYKEDLDSLFEMIIKEVPSIFDENEMKPDSILFLMLLQILSFAPLFKNPSFIEEAEWRLISLAYLNNDKKTRFDNSFWNEYCGQIEEIKNKFQLIKKDYFIRNKTLVSFLELKILNITDAIGEIVIGPKSKITIRELEDYLQLKGLKIKSKDDICDGVNVIKSRSSYTDKS